MRGEKRKLTIELNENDAELVLSYMRTIQDDSSYPFDGVSPSKEQKRRAKRVEKAIHKTQLTFPLRVPKGER